MKYRLIFPLLVSIFLFFTPFFWFKPGEMDLGGDSSRLYVYDPLHYLTSQAIYSISHSGLGGEGLGYFGIPFFLLLVILKSIFTSPTVLIAVVHGFSLSSAFLFCYLIVKQMLVQNEEKISDKSALIIEISALTAGLYYVFAPVSVLIWNHMLLTDNQIFVNPLIFFLILRYFLTRKIWYMLVALGASVLFAANFSYIGAPSFFAFFPLGFLFLILYMIFVVRKPLPVKGMLLGICLFLLLHAFHLVPQIESLLTPGSPAHDSVFSQEAKIDRGLGYFNALAEGAKPSISLTGLQQLGKLDFFSVLYLIFPMVFILGFMWNRRRLLLLTGVFFLITFFFVTANITTIGLNFYRFLFHIPGFSMFRVFFGQWEWVYLFFYMLLLGQALTVVLCRIKKWQVVSLVLFILSFLVITGWPFVSGKTLQYSHWQSKNVSALVDMDPQYEQVLEYLRQLPIDGKILSLPLSDPGYQVVKGKNNAAYEGPSTISYLAGRNEFMGYVELESFGPKLLEAVRARDYRTLRDMLSMLNVRYIYYNSDPYIYTDNYPGQPYIEVRKFFPETQKDYKEFLKEFGVKELKTIGDNYHVYEFDDSSYVPHVYAAWKTVYWGDYLTNLHIPLSFYGNDKRIAFYDDEKILERQPQIFDSLFFKAQNRGEIFDYFKVKILPRFVTPMVAQQPSSWVYPLVLLKEKAQLSLYRSQNDKFIDKSVYFIEKRINELVRWSGEISIHGGVKSIADLSKSWREPKLWEIQKYNGYNSWEITLVRYQRLIENLIDVLEKTKQSSYSITTNKVELKSDLMKHEDKLRKAIRDDSSKTPEQKRYLFNLVEDMFASLLVKLDLRLPQYWNIPYEINAQSGNGTYEVYLRKDDVGDFTYSDVALSIDGKQLKATSSEGEWVRFEDITVDKNPALSAVLSLHNFPNHTSSTVWETLEKNKIGTDSASLQTTYDFLDDTSGLIREISPWKEKSIYVISFDYQTQGRNFAVSIYEKAGSRSDSHLSNRYEEKIRSKDWKYFNTVILSGDDAQSAFIQINKDQEEIVGNNTTVKEIQIKNLNVQKIPNPRIFLKKVVYKEDTEVPKITFTRVNPTKYMVSVQGAKEPYALVLSQKFHPNWKLFSPSITNNAKTLKGALSRVVGHILKVLFQKNNIVIGEGSQSAELVTFFDGSLSEGSHKNIFLDSSTFETFGQNPIVEKTHLPANGYANSWYVTPEDVGYKQDYDLIIEMSTQKLFYRSLLISLGGLVIVLLIFLNIFKHKIQK